jgi:membrane-anchored glycerophosphoryl diester phosphodiesterase (GDPDase)
MSLFRKHWVNFALVSAVSLVPPGLLLVWFSASGTLSRAVSLADLQSGRLAQDPTYAASANAQVGASLALVVISFLFALLWSSAVVITTDAYLRDEMPALGRIYRRALGHYVAVLVSSLVYLLGVPAVGLFIVTGFGSLGTLIAIIGLLFWWLRPTSRNKRWLKWLIILTTPFGLPTYYGTRWGLYVPAAVLEHRGPIAALRRSGQVSDRHWFRVGATLAVAGLIVYVLLGLLEGLVTIPMYIFEALTRGQFGLTPVEAVVTSAVTFAVRILFASMGTIVYTLFIDLRNRREGTDIAERLGQLEATPVAVHG